jgi:hypothetical protein
MPVSSPNDRPSHQSSSFTTKHIKYRL